MIKNNFKDTIKIIIGVILLSAGAAYAGTWTGPTATFPNGNVDAPINVGGSLTSTIGDQVKIGSIWSKKSLGTDGGGYFGGILQIAGGSPGVGKVLTSDATGKGSWQAPVGGGGGQSRQVVGMTKIAGATTWTDMTDMVMTMPTTGGNVLLMFSSSFTSPGDHGDVYVRFMVDGVVKHTIADINPDLKTDAGETMPVSLQWLATGLSTGSHTFSVQWKRGTYRAVAQNGESYPRVFTAAEL